MKVTNTLRTWRSWTKNDDTLLVPTGERWFMAANPEKRPLKKNVFWASGGRRVFLASCVFVEGTEYASWYLSPFFVQVVLHVL